MTSDVSANDQSVSECYNLVAVSNEKLYEALRRAMNAVLRKLKALSKVE